MLNFIKIFGKICPHRLITENKVDLFYDMIKMNILKIPM